MTVELPLSIGQAIYAISHFQGGVIEDTVTSITVGRYEGFTGGKRRYSFDELNYKVFLGRVEAEEALARLKA